MKLFVLVLAAFIAILNTPQAGGLELLGGLGGSATGGILGSTLIDLGGLLGLRNVKCLRKCPRPVADIKLTCIKTTTFPDVKVCYGQNTIGKYLFPCQRKL